jgi:diguanylate cyclase (GGDEF)-like protein
MNAADFSTNPEVIKHYDLLDRTGVLEHIRRQQLRLRDLERIIDEGVDLFSTHSVDELVNGLIARLLNRFVPSYLTFVFEDRLAPQATRIISFKNLQPMPPPVSATSLEPVREFLAHHPDPVSFSVLEKALADRSVTDQLLTLDPEIVVPIRGLGGIYGFVVFGRKVVDTDYTEREIDYIDKLMKFASIGLQNNIHFRTAITDQKTGLYNHSYFMTRLEQEIARVGRYGGEMAVLLVDVDHFKRFNDTFGHLAGDQVLAALARTLERSVRRSDVASRFGGEEFVLLLAQCSEREAQLVAERVRSSVESTAIDYQDQVLHVTVSVGGYHLDEHASLDGHTIVKHADAALYASKQQGRNRTTFFDQDLSSAPESYLRRLED